MPSCRAMLFSASGANQRVLSHSRTCVEACSLGPFAGSRPLGAIDGSAALGWATSALAQNGHDPATSGGSNTTTLPHELQVTSSAWAVSGCNFTAPAADIYSSNECGGTSAAPPDAGSA